MPRRAEALAVMLLAGALLFGDLHQALAQERTAAATKVKVAGAATAAPKLRVRMVTADQATLPVRTLDATAPAGTDSGSQPSRGDGMALPVRPGDILGGDRAGIEPAKQMQRDNMQRDNAASLFDALVSPSRSIAGFDGPTWRPEEGGGSIAIEVQAADAATSVGSNLVPGPVAGASSADGASYRVPGSLAPTAAPTGGEYVLGPGDVIEVFVWRNPELSREVPVRPDGRISLPLAGEIVATGKSVEHLRREIAEALSQYVQMPNVTVGVKQIRSLVVYVLGNVAKSGPVQMERNLTVLQAIAMAGGLNEFANRKDIVVLRTDEFGVHQRWAFRYDDVVGGRSLETNLLLRAGDVVYVP